MIHRASTYLMSFLAAFSLLGCGSNNVNSDSQESQKKENSSSQDSNSIVVYFSRTNNTEKIASYISEITNSESSEILAKVPYTDDDIKYYTGCRADKEQADPNARPEIGSEHIDLKGFDTIYLGYPIWHGDAPKIMYTFVESYDLSGKTMIPFCTSASSSIGNSASNLAKLAPSANWLTGKRFAQGASKDEVQSWIDTLNK